MLKYRVYIKPTHRNTSEGILSRIRIGCPYRDVPESFVDWIAIYKRFNLWSKKGFNKTFQSIQVIAYRGYDSELLREKILDKNAIPVIKREKYKVGMLISIGDLKYRHLVENVLARLKLYRGIATIYDKINRNYESTLALACAIIWLPMQVVKLRT